MNSLKKLKKDKKGFTLVELIVVLVILAILAAIMVPALLGWIDKAREKQYVIDARSVYVAAQAKASEKYAKEDADGLCTFNVAETTEIINIAAPSRSIKSDFAIIWKGSTGKDAYTIDGMMITFTDNTVCALFGDQWLVSTTSDTKITLPADATDRTNLANYNGEP